MKVTVRKKVCSTCPFREENKHQIIVPAVRDMLDKGIISPCHQDLAKYSGSTTKGVEMYAQIAPEFQVCRGYAEMRKDVSHPHDVWYHIEDLMERNPLKQDVKIAKLKDIL